MKLKNKLLGAAVVSAATLGVAAPSFALTDLIGNAPGNYPSAFGIRSSVISPTGTSGVDENGNPNTSGQQKAVFFTTPTDAAPEELELNNLTLLLQSLDASDGAAFNFSTGGPTNTPVLTLDNDDISPATPISNALNFYTYEPSVPFSFTAGTTYYLTATASNSSYNWVTPALGNEEAPNGLATFNGYQFSDDGGNTFANSGQYNTFAIQTNTAAVPFDFSPASGLLLVGGLWGVNRLRKRNAAKIEE